MYQHCSVEWHLVKLQSRGTAAPLYSLAVQMTKAGGVFAPTIAQLAAYMNRNEQTVRRALHQLVEIGLFEIVSNTPGCAVCYRPVQHRTWAAAHPGKCFNSNHGTGAGVSS